MNLEKHSQHPFQNRRKIKNQPYSRQPISSCRNGGRGGIRTPDHVRSSPTTHHFCVEDSPGTHSTKLNYPPFLSILASSLAIKETFPWKHAPLARSNNHYCHSIRGTFLPTAPFNHALLLLAVVERSERKEAIRSFFLWPS